jgi:SPP1 family predicted phage head-tail adaptor
VKTRIGKLRHRLTIEQETRVADGGGGSVSAWAPVAEVWAAVEATGGGERVAADRLGGEVACRVTIRHRADLGPAMRFRRGAEVFAILAVLDRDGRRRFLDCHCERRDP